LAKSALQSKIDEHINDPDSPRYTVVLEGVGGNCVLPKGLRLFLSNCPSVTVTSAAGDNQLEYRNGAGITVLSFSDGKILVENAAGCDFISIAGAHVQLKNVQANNLHLNRCTMHVQDSVFQNGDLETVRAEMSRTTFEILATNRTQVYHHLGSVTQLNTVESEYRSEEITVTNWVSSSGSELQLVDTAVTGSLSATESSVRVDECNAVHTLSLSGGDLTVTDSQFPSTVSTTGARLLSRDSTYFGRLSASGGRVHLDGDSCPSGLTLSAVRSILRRCSLESISVTGESVRTHDISVSGTTSLTGATIESSRSTYDGAYSQSGGTLVSKKDTHSAALSCSGLVGRNKVFKGSHSTLSLTGDGKSHLELAEIQSEAALASGFSLLKADSPSCSSLSVSSVGQALVHSVAAAVTAVDVGQLLTSNCSSVHAERCIVLDSGSSPVSGTSSLLIYRNTSGEYVVQTDLKLNLIGDHVNLSGNQINLNATQITITGDLATVGDMHTAGVHTDNIGTHV